MNETATNQPIVMNMPKELVEAHIKALVLDTCLKNGDTIVRHMVDAVLMEKVDYGRQTRLDKQIAEMIVELAKLTAKEWIQEQAPKIKQAIRKRLDADKSKVISSLCDQLADRLVSGVHVSVSINERG